MTIKTFALIPNEEKDIGLNAAKKISGILYSLGMRVVADEKYVGIIPNADYMQRDVLLAVADIAVVIGGDGSMLNLAADASAAGVPIVGINYGNLGFLTQAERDETHIFQDICNGNYKIESRIMMNGSIVADGLVVAEINALNDIIIHRGDKSKMINICVYISGRSAAEYRADGIIVATPTGSTAYSLSAGGPIVSPDVEAFVITPICPHSIGKRSLVVSSKEKISIHAEGAVVEADGKAVFDSPDYVNIVKADHTVDFIWLNERNFFDVLNRKL